MSPSKLPQPSVASEVQQFKNTKAQMVESMVKDIQHTRRSWFTPRKDNDGSRCSIDALLAETHTQTASAQPAPTSDGLESHSRPQGKPYKTPFEPSQDRPSPAKPQTKSGRISTASTMRATKPALPYSNTHKANTNNTTKQSTSESSLSPQVPGIPPPPPPPRLPAPPSPDTEPSLFLQAADATGGAWFAEDDTCIPPKRPALRRTRKTIFGWNREQ